MTPVDWEKIHEEKRFRPLTAPLALISFLYGIGVRYRLAIVKRKKKRVLPGFVLSFGNLTVGGTGKTPVTSMMAKWAFDKGYKVAVLSRGYGGQYGEKVLIVSDGKKILVGPRVSGDEPYLLAQRAPGVPVVVSKDRFLAGNRANERFGSNFFILDDGFQYINLKRDLDIVLLDAKKPFGNGHLLPWGPLREPIRELQRADAILFTRAKTYKKGLSSALITGKKLEGKPLFTGNHIPENLVFPINDQVHVPEFLRGKRVIAFAGIARPETFRKTIIGLGAHPVLFRGYRDHYQYSRVDIQELNGEKDRLKADFMVTTEKDWIRMKDIITEYPDISYLKISFSLLSGKEKFINMIQESAGKILEM